MDSKHLQSVVVSYSPEDDNGITDKQGLISFVGVPQVHQSDSGWCLLGFTFSSMRILKFMFASIAFLTAFYVFCHWFIFQTVSNIEDNGELVSESQNTYNKSFESSVNVESRYATNATEMLLVSGSTLTATMTTVTTTEPTTTEFEIPSTAETPTPKTTTLSLTSQAGTTTPTTTTVPTTTKPKLEGNVKIRVIRASLPKTDFWSDTDPFVKVTVANRNLGQTSMIKNNRYPYWNKYFNAYSVKVNNWINFMVYDADVTRSVMIGEKDISIKEIVENNNLGKELRLVVCPTTECEIFVEVNWTWL